MRETDPRFDAKVVLTDLGPLVELRAIETVGIRLVVAKESNDALTRFQSVIDFGTLAAFGPGEIRIEGSPLFADFEQIGGQLQVAINEAAVVNLICRSEVGEELCRLTDVPGRVTGGMRETWFNGGFDAGPLTVRVGPFAETGGGMANLSLAFDQWNGRPLLQLPYFDGLHTFFQSFHAGKLLEIEIQREGVRWASVHAKIGDAERFQPVAKFVEWLWKAQQVAVRFQVNPAWNMAHLASKDSSAIEELYGIFFLGKWTESARGVTIRAAVDPSDRRSCEAIQVLGNTPIRLESECKCPFLGLELDVGNLAHEYSAVSVSKIESGSASRLSNLSRRRPRSKTKADVCLAFRTSDDAILTITRVE